MSVSKTGENSQLVAITLIARLQLLGVDEEWC